MFKSRSDKSKRTNGTEESRESHAPLTESQDGKDYDPEKFKSSNQNIDGDGEKVTEEAVQAQESKRRKRRIMKIALYCVLGVVALGVFAIWLLHKDAIETLRFGVGFVFTVKLRSLEIINDNGDSVLYGDLGRYLLATPYDHCWDPAFEYYEDYCLYWKDMAFLKVVKDENSTSSCYTFTWDGLQEDFLAQDCFYLQRYKWYGYLTNSTPPWPISNVRLEAENYYTEYPNEQTEHLVPTWFGSQGVSIFVDPSFPFTVEWNVTDRCQLCITSKLTTRSKLDRLTLLNYTVCQAKSIKEVYNVSRKHRMDEDTDFPLEEQPESSLLSQPIYALNTKEDLPELLKIMKGNESKCSLIELYNDWEGEYGNLSVDSRMMDNVQKLLEESIRQDCYPILPISTFFSYKSQYYKDGINNSYFVRDRQNLVTRMIKWRGHEGAVLDVTNPNAQHWFLEHVRKLVKQFNVKALKLLNLSVPPDSKYFDGNMTHLDYTRIFYRDMSTLNISLVLELATGFIPLPVYVPIQMKFFKVLDSFCLNATIPYSLMMGLSGFPLLTAVADKTAMDSITTEMFKLWLQIAVFYPVLEIPSTLLLKSVEMQDFLQEALALRNREFLPYLTQVWEQQPTFPIIRPLWWAAPQDRHAQVISDQFLVGDRLLVAPVLCEGEEVKIVYLPQGVWHGCNMTSVVGPRIVKVETHNFTIIPYFWREDTVKANG